MGQEIARRLAEEGHDITVIDTDTDCLEEISTGVDAMVLYGNGADYTVLTEAGVGEADLLIAVTSDDSVNMLCCLTGKKLGVKNTVARVRTMEYFRQMVFLKDELGLSLVLNPEQAAAAEISRILRFPSAAKVESFAKGRAEMVEFTLAPESPLCGLRLVKLRDKHSSNILICAVEHDGQVIIPKGDFVLSAGDTLHVVGPSAEMSAFFKAVGSYRRSVRDVLILGGGRISLYLGSALIESGIRVRILERNEEHCEIIKGILPRAEILLGDGTNPQGARGGGHPHHGRLRRPHRQRPEQHHNLHVRRPLRRRQGHHQGERRLLPPHGGLPQARQLRHAQEHRRGQHRHLRPRDAELHRRQRHRVPARDSRRQRRGAGVLHKAPAEYPGHPPAQLSIRRDTLLAAIIRGNECIIPGGNDCVRMHDSVIAVTTRFGMQRFDDIFEE